MSGLTIALLAVIVVLVIIIIILAVKFYNFKRLAEYIIGTQALENGFISEE